MRNRWLILFVLFFARTIMAFQFQSVAALSPLIMDSLGLTLVDIGLLIGIYLGPGIIVATLGGSVASYFGDKRVVILSLILMVVGSVLVAYASTMSWVVAGRIISGIGGVVVNVVMTKMVIDWFSGRSIATAMAIFISSWPLGIALSLLILPGLGGVGGVGGLGLAWNGVILATALALILFVVVYKNPSQAATRGKLAVTNLPWLPLILVAVVWALYNAAFAMVFGFGTLILTERGFDITDASSAISLNILAGTIAIPVGGWIADRTGRRDAVILTSLIAGLVMYPAVLYLPQTYAVVMLGLAGFLVGLAPGPIVSLTSYILPVDARGFGTGVFYSVYYALMMIAPAAAGATADLVSNVSVTFILASAMMGIAILALAGFRRTAIAVET